MSVAAIILAAGASRRLGRPKQLVQFDGETLLGRALRLAQEAGTSPTVAVLGAQFESISAAIPFNAAISIFNPQWEQGISTSIRAGLHELETRALQASGVLIMTCDQPRLTSAHISALLAEFGKLSDNCIIASSYAETVGIPAIFPRSVFPMLQALTGDKGARAVLLTPPCPLISVPFDGGEVDIDFPSDLANLQKS
ncbi:MAG TPA: nucleotidyltransferase family protein [Terracidiphilus sp.]|jgi:molybdenum cofactor cytidylyltransferase|nr:nucleotidyltransferase family protein [Terracidiphilus sp.]